jgi:Protein of unknown function (DUF1566)
MTKSMPTLGIILIAAVLAAWGGWVTPAFAAARFIDEGDGTVEDTRTDLIWLKNANCFGVVTWAQAQTDANTLASGSCGLTDGSVAGDWRVPTLKELQSLIDDRFFAPALSNAAGTAKWQENDAFSRVESAVYWTSTTYAGPPGGVWCVVLNIGHTFVAAQDETNLVWPVRGRRRR